MEQSSGLAVKWCAAILSLNSTSMRKPGERYKADIPPNMFASPSTGGECMPGVSSLAVVEKDSADHDQANRPNPGERMRATLWKPDFEPS
jgi:hypothetical protein